jgi:hypothetical protein
MIYYIGYLVCLAYVLLESVEEPPASFKDNVMIFVIPAIWPLLLAMWMYEVKKSLPLPAKPSPTVDARTNGKAEGGG